jgi:hypothetical protein
MRPGRQLFSLLAWLFLTACTPALDWREVRPPGGGFVVLLPQKPAQSERRLVTPAGPVLMRMYSVRVGEHVLAAGFADFPAALEAPLQDALRDALLANINGQVINEREITAAGMRGREFSAKGTLGRGADAQTGLLQARLLVRGQRYFQLVSLGAPGSLQQADIEFFLSSLKLD